MSVFRPVANACFRRALSTSFSRSLSRPALASQHRYYAKKSTSTAEKFVPGSQQPLTDPVSQAEYAKCEEKMKAAIDWFRKDCAQGTTRATGRITPALLKDVRVDGEPLQNMATIGVRDGSILVVTVFEESTLKDVEGALYEAKLPGITPQRVDARTIRLPVPKPTVDAKTEMATGAGRKAEDARVQCRKFHQASVKKGKYEKRSIELDTFQKLLDKYIAEIDKLLVDTKKTLGIAR
ncbi:ribosome recycling factor [Hymenopellis radicata]|nr:ribosome recycling factor [Hymenopellis radicata]